MYLGLCTLLLQLLAQETYTLGVVVRGVVCMIYPIHGIIFRPSTQVNSLIIFNNHQSSLFKI